MKTSFGTAGLIRRAIPPAALLIAALIALCCLQDISRSRTGKRKKLAEDRSEASANALPGWLRSPGYAVALGISAGHFGISSRHDAQELRSLPKVSSLHFQLDGSESLHDDEGILSRRFRKAETLCGNGPMVSSGLVDVRKRRQLAFARIHHSPSALRQRIFPPRIRQG